MSDRIFKVRMTVDLQATYEVEVSEDRAMDLVDDFHYDGAEHCTTLQMREYLGMAMQESNLQFLLEEDLPPAIATDDSELWHLDNDSVLTQISKAKVWVESVGPKQGPVTRRMQATAECHPHR